MKDGLNSGQVAFYATVATAIPVFLLGYVFVATTFVRRAADWMQAQLAPFVEAFLEAAMARNGKKSEKRMENREPKTSSGTRRL